jgi:hypothetical protein
MIWAYLLHGNAAAAQNRRRKVVFFAIACAPSPRMLHSATTVASIPSEEADRPQNQADRAQAHAGVTPASYAARQEGEYLRVAAVGSQRLRTKVQRNMEAPI